MSAEHVRSDFSGHGGQGCEGPDVLQAIACGSWATKFEGDHPADRGGRTRKEALPRALAPTRRPHGQLLSRFEPEGVCADPG